MKIIYEYPIDRKLLPKFRKYQLIKVVLFVSGKFKIIKYDMCCYTAQNNQFVVYPKDLLTKKEMKTYYKKQKITEEEKNKKRLKELEQKIEKDWNDIIKNKVACNHLDLLWEIREKITEVRDRIDES